MQVSRQGNRIIIDVAPNTDLVGIQRLLDYIQYREVASKSKATQEQTDELAKESKANWWKENREKFIK